jgi:uracil-DNA glycosylase
MTDLPKLLADPHVRADRRAKLHESHIAPLTEFVEALRTDVGPDMIIPQFDPWDGGVDAEILYLLEAPGPQAVASGFVSRNNPDESAKNFFELNTEAKIPRKRTVTWNVVPWYIGNSKTIRAAKRTDLEHGIHLLPKLLSLLPKLRAVVFVGRKSEYAREMVMEQLPNVKIFCCPHPSPQCLNTNPANRGRIIDVLREVATTLTVFSKTETRNI